MSLDSRFPKERRLIPKENLKSWFVDKCVRYMYQRKIFFEEFSLISYLIVLHILLTNTHVFLCLFLNLYASQKYVACTKT